MLQAKIGDIKYKEIKMKHPKIIFTKDKQGDLSIKKIDKYILQDGDINLCLIIGNLLKQYAKTVTSVPQKYIDMYGDCDKAYCKYAEKLDTVGSDFIWLANNKFSIPEIQEKYDMLFTVCFDWLKDNLSNIW